MTALHRFFAPGIPLAKGSKAHVGGGRLVEQADRKTKTRRAGGLKRWMETIANAARVARVSEVEGAVDLDLRFVMPRPKTVKRPFPTVSPDVDKLARAVLDALEGIAYRNDAQVVEMSLSKDYVGSDTEPGVYVEIWSAE